MTNQTVASDSCPFLPVKRMAGECNQPLHWMLVLSRTAPMPRNNSILRFRLSILGASLLLVLPAFAHETLPRNWCLDPNTVPKVLLSFNFTEADLISYRRDHPLPSNDNCRTDSSCGIVDDWFWANEMSQAFCSATALRSALPQASEGMPFVNLPTVFNGSEHHRLYNFHEGLKGACVVCVPNPAAPAPEKPSPPVSATSIH